MASGGNSVYRTLLADGRIVHRMYCSVGKQKSRSTDLVHNILITITIDSSSKSYLVHGKFGVLTEP